VCCVVVLSARRRITYLRSYPCALRLILSDFGLCLSLTLISPPLSLVPVHKLFVCFFVLFCSLPAQSSTFACVLLLPSIRTDLFNPVIFAGGLVLWSPLQLLCAPINISVCRCPVVPNRLLIRSVSVSHRFVVLYITGRCTVVFDAPYRLSSVVSRCNKIITRPQPTFPLQIRRLQQKSIFLSFVHSHFLHTSFACWFEGHRVSVRPSNSIFECRWTVRADVSSFRRVNFCVV